MAKRIYDADRAAAFEAGLATLARCGFVITHSDKDAGLIGFKAKASMWSWGQEGSIVVTKELGGRVGVTVATRAGFQLTDWGEGKRLARRIFAILDESLPSASAEM